MPPFLGMSLWKKQGQPTLKLLLKTPFQTSFGRNISLQQQRQCLKVEE